MHARRICSYHGKPFLNEGLYQALMSSERHFCFLRKTIAMCGIPGVAQN